ncbi:MAG TPA: radical SAM family heme chaperone HemW [Actinomycetota bacterium]|nr:radical SAM family heme chaperone HemW [Actinomycetota bacterium]
MVRPAERLLPRPRDVLGAFGIYVHVPFCTRRCWYCDFNAYAGLDHLAPQYMSALAEDARRALSAPEPFGERPVVTSVFFGGGTPSLVEPGLLTAVLDAVRESWPVDPGAEVTVECNPESIDRDRLLAYRAAGVTRLSFGVQSLDDRLLASLGRVHDAATAVGALVLARSVFERVSGDLIFGVPGEDDRTWRSSVEGLLSLGLEHMSCYGLTYEEGTPLHSWKRLGKVVPVDDDDSARRWEMTDDLLSARGLRRYEVSNWAVPGHECRHNQLYWACGEYLGIGAGAHSHLARPDGCTRSWTVKSPERYVREVFRGASPVAGAEHVDAAGRASEAMFLGLRRAGGVRSEEFQALTGLRLEDLFRAELERWSRAGLLRWEETGARLTRRGTLLANEVLASMLAG